MSALAFSDYRIQSLLWPIQAPVQVWNTSSAPPTVMTYQFDSAQPSDVWNVYSGWTAFSDSAKAAVRSALAEYQSIINVKFVEDPFSVDPDINLGRVTLGPHTGGEGAFQYYYFINGDGTVTSKILDSYAVWSSGLDLSAAANRGLVLHELGHVLTLKHPGAYDVTGSLPPGPYLPAGEDNNKYTVMSYNANPENGADSDHPMLYDIAALQARFGANMTTRTGNDVYTGPWSDRSHLGCGWCRCD